MNANDENAIYIKAPRLRGTILFVLSMVFFAAAIYCLFIPLSGIITGDCAEYLSIAYYVVGSIGTAFFAYKATFNLLRLITPQTAVVITDLGLFDYTIPNDGMAYVAWDNIADIKLFGKKKCDWLGISLKSNSKVFLGLNKKAKQDIRERIESGMPAVILKSDDIALDLYELRSMINENIKRFREANRTRVITAKSAPAALKDAAAAKTMEETADGSVASFDDTINIPDHPAKEKQNTQEKPLSANENNDDAKTAEFGIVKPASKQSDTPSDKSADDGMLTLELDVAATKIKPDANAEEKQQTANPDIRTLEIPKRPETRKDIKKDDIDSIDDILAALSETYKTKKSKKSSFSSPLSEILDENEEKGEGDEKKD